MTGGIDRFTARWLGDEAVGVVREHLERPEAARLRTFATMCGEALGGAPEMAQVGVVSELHESCRLATALQALPAPRHTPNVIVAGLPRSGTTALQELLAEASDVTTTAIGWHLATSRLEDIAQGRGVDQRRAVQEVDARYQAVTSVNPRLAALHPLGAHRLEECTPLYRATARHFPWAFILSTPEVEGFLTADFGSAEVHGGWLTAVGTLPSRGGLVVKSPIHTGYLGSIASACPDARIVVTRRSAESILRSFAVMTHEARAPFANKSDLHQSGAQALRILRRLAHALRDAVDNGVHLEVVDVADVERSPSGVVERLWGGTHLRWRAADTRQARIPAASGYPSIPELGLDHEDVDELAALAPELCTGPAQPTT